VGVGVREGVGEGRGRGRGRGWVGGGGCSRPCRPQRLRPHGGVPSPIITQHPGANAGPAFSCNGRGARRVAVRRRLPEWRPGTFLQLLRADPSPHAASPPPPPSGLLPPLAVARPAADTCQRLPAPALSRPPEWGAVACAWAHGGGGGAILRTPFCACTGPRCGRVARPCSRARTRLGSLGAVNGPSPACMGWLMTGEALKEDREGGGGGGA
jgi:hypothetical protein